MTKTRGLREVGIAVPGISGSIRDIVFTAIDGELNAEEREELYVGGAVAVKVWITDDNQLRAKIIKTRRVKS